MSKNEHIHKFKRVKFKSGNPIFFCALPDCSKRMNPALALGKRTLCWICGEPFLLTDYSIRLVKPHCEACHKPKKQKEEKEWIHEPSEQEIEATKELIGTISLAERMKQALKPKEQEEDEL